MTGLRERRHRETAEQLVDVAFELFTERGFTDVSMEEIARAAGVSRSTVYRRFPTKDDVVLEIPRRWLRVFDDAIADMPDSSSLPEAVRTATLAVAAHIDQHEGTVRTAYAVLQQSPSLQHSGVATTAWLRRLVEVFEWFSSADTETSVVLAGAYLGAIDSMMLHWASTGGTDSVAASTERLLARLAPLLEPLQTRRVEAT